MSLAAPPRPVQRRESRAALELHPSNLLRCRQIPPSLRRLLCQRVLLARMSGPRSGSAAASPPRHDMRASIGDAASYSVMVGIGETYLPAFALALGTGETFAGLIATMPMLTGAALQLATPWALRRFGSYRTWVVLCACLQATALLLDAAWPPCFMGTPSLAATWVFVAATAYWAASQAAGPAWNTWIEEIIPKRVAARSSLPAGRGRARCACCSALRPADSRCTLPKPTSRPPAESSGGCSLRSRRSLWSAPAAGSFRRPSSAIRASRRRGDYVARPVSIGQIVQHDEAGTSAAGWCCICSPCKRQCRFPARTSRRSCSAKKGWSYLSYMVLIGICFLGKAIALPMWGRVAHYAGARRLLWIGGTAIVPIAALWLFIDSFHWLDTTVHLPIGAAGYDLTISRPDSLRELLAAHFGHRLGRLRAGDAAHVLRGDSAAGPGRRADVLQLRQRRGARPGEHHRRDDPAIAGREPPGVPVPVRHFVGRAAPHRAAPLAHAASERRVRAAGGSRDRRATGRRRPRSADPAEPVGQPDDQAG